MDENLRLFVACGPLTDWGKTHHRSLIRLKSELKAREVEALWSPAENLHITLCFLGDVLSSNLPEIQSRLGEAATLIPPFRLKTKGLGAFPELESARVMFADVGRSKPLLAAQSLLEERLELESTEVYNPHITLARLRNLKSLRRIIEPWRNQFSGVLEIESIRLFKSVTEGKYRVYVPLATFELTGA